MKEVLIMNWRPNIDVTVNNYEILYSNNDITGPICKTKNIWKIQKDLNFLLGNVRDKFILYIKFRNLYVFDFLGGKYGKLFNVTNFVL